MNPTVERQAYEQFLAKIKLDLPPIRLNAIEHGNVPPIVAAWEPWMTPAELWAAYRTRYQRDWPALFGPRFGEAIRARVLRAWPSLARDHHLYLLLREEYTTVIRSRELDEEWGIDCLVIVGPHAYAVHAYVATPRSQYFRQRKTIRHASHLAVGIPVELPLDLDHARRLGEVCVYSPADLWPLEEAIELAERKAS